MHRLPLHLLHLAIDRCRHGLPGSRIDHGRSGRIVRIVDPLCLLRGQLRLLCGLLCLLLHGAVVRHRHATGVIVVDAILGNLESQRIEHAILLG
ncbi:hypothetical protein D3C75_1172150 [compost metagenome]